MATEESINLEDCLCGLDLLMTNELDVYISASCLKEPYISVT